MKKLALATILSLGLASILSATTDFSSMTTEDLLSLKGTVATEEREAFQEELQSRVSTMTAEEKEALGISPKGYGDMTETAPKDGTGLGNSSGFGGSSGSSMGGGNGHGGGRR